MSTTLHIPKYMVIFLVFCWPFLIHPAYSDWIFQHLYIFLSTGELPSNSSYKLEEQVFWTEVTFP
jgi:hypothetical protein